MRFPRTPHDAAVLAPCYNSESSPAIFLPESPPHAVRPRATETRLHPRRRIRLGHLAVTRPRGEPAVAAAVQPAPTQAVRHLLYVTEPGIRNDLQYGGAGILVFDIDGGHRFVRRIETPASQVAKPENVKGVCGVASTGRLYLSTLSHLYCLDLTSDRPIWQKSPPGGCDRMSITPDGKTLFVPSLEGAFWNVIDAASGEVVGKIETKSGAITQFAAATALGLIALG